MPIRITGMNSGLDTESIITALTSTKKTKVQNLQGEQKKLTWKQDKLKELNKKVVNFYNGALSSMRFSSAYTKKATTSNNSSAVSVITGDDAMLTDQSLNITSLAKSAYMTGNKVTYKEGEGEDAKTNTATKSTTMDKLGINETTSLELKIGKSADDPDAKSLAIDIDSTDTISKVLSKLKSKASEIGVDMNFNYDEANGRFYVSSGKTGEDYNFFTTGSDAATALGFNNDNYVKGSSAKIELNGVEYTSNNNTFSVNGLTITAKEVANDITLSTKQDTSGIYDNVKNLIKEYNSLMKELATLYNADPAKKYSMLNDDQKDEMSDKEVEEWETKIKDGLLSKDENIGNLRNAIRDVVNSSFEIKLKDGTTSKLSLASFGISTGGYFTTEENEREVLHIDGDADDSTSSGNTDLLRAAISTDPKKVQDFFTEFSRSLYSKIGDLMKGTQYSSAFTIYEDKLMASQYSSYNTKISNAQKALEAAEDKYYKQFSSMETALAKINSASGSLSGFFGG